MLPNVSVGRSLFFSSRSHFLYVLLSILIVCLYTLGSAVDPTESVNTVFENKLVAKNEFFQIVPYFITWMFSLKA